MNQQEQKPDVANFASIDRYALDLEWIKQVRQVAYYGELWAKARSRLEKAKRAAQLYETEVAKKVRQKPTLYGLKRPTESAIKEIVQYRTLGSKAHDELIEAKYQVDLLDTVMKALDSKKRALSDLVYLHGQSYFAEPKIPESIRESVEQRKDSLIRGLRRNKV